MFWVWILLFAPLFINIYIIIENLALNRKKTVKKKQFEKNYIFQDASGYNNDIITDYYFCHEKLTNFNSEDMKN